MFIGRSLLLVALLILAGCRSKPERSTPMGGRRADGALVLSDAGASYVRVERARPATEVRPRSFVGRITFDERKVARLGPAMGGRVTSVRVVTGDSVRSGDVLLTVLAPDLASAQAQVAQARSSRELAERAAERARTLVREGAGSQAELQQAETALVQAQNEERRAIDVSRAIGGGASSVEYVLRSPISGSVIERNVAVGTQVSPSSEKPLLTVGDLSTVWAVVDVFEQDVPRVAQGADVSIHVLALKDRTYTGKVTFVSSVVDPRTRAVEARIELANDRGELKPGMAVRAIVRGDASSAAEVPMSAVLARRDQFFVFVRQGDGSFVQREVELGGQKGEHATITKNLAPGEEVVTEGAILLDVEANESLR